MNVNSAVPVSASCMLSSEIFCFGKEANKSQARHKLSSYQTVVIKYATSLTLKNPVFRPEKEFASFSWFSAWTPRLLYLIHINFVCQGLK